MSMLNMPGARLWYEIEGSGSLLILIPGASGAGESVSPLAQAFATQYQVVTHDRRRFSRSHLDGSKSMTIGSRPMPVMSNS